MHFLTKWPQEAKEMERSDGTSGSLQKHGPELQLSACEGHPFASPQQK